MKIKLAKYDAIELLELYYTRSIWPLNEFSIRDMYTVSDGGDGSSSIIWDLIDLEGQRVLKAEDYYDSECGGNEKEDTPRSQDEMYENLYEEILSNVDTRSFRGGYPTAISLKDVVEAIVLGVLNENGYKRHIDTIREQEKEKRKNAETSKIDD